MRKSLMGIISGGLIVLTLLITGSKVSAANSTWQKSVMIQSESTNDYASSTFDQSVNNAISDGANYIVLVIPIGQSNIYSSDVQVSSSTPSDQALQAAITYIHNKGAHVALSLHDDPWDGSWRAYINPTDRPTWFANYNKLLVHFASIGQINKVEEISIGTEMNGVTSPQINNTNTANWLNMIQAVRNVFSGSVFYTAQHNGWQSDLNTLQFWPKLDYIGVSAYYGLGSGDESPATIESFWKNVETNYIKPVALQYGKPVLFSEIGYVSGSNAIDDPGAAYGNPGSYDPTLQANAYQALFEYWQNSSYMNGVALWNWSSNPNAGGNGDLGYTPQNKPAEQVMKKYFSSGSTVVTPSVNSSFTISNTSSNAAMVGVAKLISLSITANQSVSGTVVDLELYDSNGIRVGQQYFENQNLSTTASNYSLNWTPATSGTYTLKAGIFTSNWVSNLIWNNALSTITVSAVPVVTPPPVTPTPIGTPNPGVVNSNISIWWPGNVNAVSGVQPFKAVLNGFDLNNYQMFWQVDGGSLNSMSNNYVDAPHKEAAVNVQGWNWSPNSHYTVNFIAEDSTGKIIAQQSVVIIVAK